MKAVEKIIDVIFKAVEWVIAFLVGLMTVLVFMQIVNRAILNVSLTWSEEIVNYSMIWIAMLGACVLVRNNGQFYQGTERTAEKGDHGGFRAAAGSLCHCHALGDH